MLNSNSSGGSLVQTRISSPRLTSRRKMYNGGSTLVGGSRSGKLSNTGKKSRSHRDEPGCIWTCEDSDGGAYNITCNHPCPCTCPSTDPTVDPIPDPYGGFV